MMRFFLFCAVGTGGFLVDSGVFIAAATLFPTLLSRFLSFSAAVLFTYVLNRRLTFHVTDRAHASEFCRYYANMVLGGAVNIGVFYVAFVLAPFVKTYPIAGIALGSIAGLIVNFLTSKLLFQKNEKTY